MGRQEQLISLDSVRTGSVKMYARNFISMVVAASITSPAFAQTQPTRPSAYRTIPTLPSAWATAALSPCYPSHGYRGPLLGYFNPSSPCYSGTIYPSYSAVTPFEFPKGPNWKAETPSSESLDKDQATSLIVGKGYLDVTGLEKDTHGIWRGKAAMEDGRPVNVVLDLEGNIYSILSRLHIRIEPPPNNR